eukprot:359531-Chlamydomonas_euryale.AAC.3
MRSTTISPACTGLHASLAQHDDFARLLPQLMPPRVQVPRLGRQDHVLSEAELNLDARDVLWRRRDVDDVKLPKQEVVGRNGVVAVEHKHARRRLFFSIQGCGCGMRARVL